MLDSIIYSVENLQVLETNRLSGSGVRWNEGRLKKLLKTFPELRGFGGDVEMVEVGWVCRFLLLGLRMLFLYLLSVIVYSFSILMSRSELDTYRFLWI